MADFNTEEYKICVELFNKVVSTIPEVKRKGKTMPYTSLNGNMFSFLDKEGKMGLRLSKVQREEFIEKYNTKLSVQYGAVMKEYVVVPDELLQNTDKLAFYFDKSFEYAKTLKPKPTTKKKKD